MLRPRRRIVILGLTAVTIVAATAVRSMRDRRGVCAADVANDCSAGTIATSAVLKRVAVGLSAPPSVGTKVEPGSLSTKLLLVGIVGDAGGSLSCLGDRLRSLFVSGPLAQQPEEDRYPRRGRPLPRRCPATGKHEEQQSASTMAIISTAHGNHGYCLSKSRIARWRVRWDRPHSRPDRP